MQEQINTSLELIKNGKVILYPTDTVVGLGCDATNIEAINRIFDIKKRPQNKSLILLVSSDAMLNRYVEEVPELAWDIIDCSDKPTTIVYSNPKNLPKEALAEDGSIAIRIVRDGFCNKLIHKLNKPIVSTSANLAGASTPSTVKEVSKQILEQVDYIVDLPNTSTNKSSSIIKIELDGTIKIIRS